MKIDDVMNKKVHFCRPEDSMRTAAQLMWEQDIGCVPVVDAERRVVGIVTDRDLAMSVFLTGTRLDERPVSSAMAADVCCARLGQTVASAWELMRTRQVRRLPVVDDARRLAGIVTLNDLALASGKLRGVKPEDVSVTVASICQPRHAPQPQEHR